ncbi:MAG: hypothetical protein AAGI50_02775 [Pseudomonadota bacterium]
MYGSIRFAALFAVAALAACDQPQVSSSDLRFVPLTRDFELGGVRWQDGRGGFSYLWNFIPFEGQLYLCGVGAQEGQQRTRINTQAVASHVFYVNEQRAFRGIAHFGRAKDFDDMLNRPAVCAPTGVPEPEGQYTVRVEATKTSFRI